MRNLEEYKAEVFRRSEERIKKRKKNQKYMLALGSTFVLCITICLVLVKSDVLHLVYDAAENDVQMILKDDVPNLDNPQDSNGIPNSDNPQDSNGMSNSDNSQESNVQDETENNESHYVKFEVETYGESQMNSHTVTDETQVAELFEMIQRIFDNEEGVVREESSDFDSILSENGNQDDSNDFSSENSLKNMEYVIRFQTSNETYQMYALNRGVLLDFTKEEALVLTEEELLDLKVAMGVEK